MTAGNNAGPRRPLPGAAIVLLGAALVCVSAGGLVWGGEAPPVPMPAPTPTPGGGSAGGPGNGPGGGAAESPAAPPASAAEAVARADREFQAGQWVEAFADYAAACRFFAQQQQQAEFERNGTQAARAQLHALACLGEMHWLYQRYPTPAPDLPVIEALYGALAKQPQLQGRAGRLALAIAGDAGNVAAQKRLRTEQNFLADWQILGPTFAETELEPPLGAKIADEAVNTAFGPLHLTDPSLALGQTVAVRGMQVAWRHLPDIPLDGRIPLHALIPPASGRRALLATWLKVPTRQDLNLVFAVNGPLRVYHDYAPVVAWVDGSDGVSVEVGVTLRLHAGWNRLILELEAPVNRTEAEGDIALGRLLAQEPAVGWWLSCRTAKAVPDLVVDAVRDHPIDDRARPTEDDFTRDIRPYLSPALPTFPTMPEDIRTWSDVHRDLLIAWMQAAGDAAGGSRQARATVVQQVIRFAPVMQDDLRFTALLARLTPPGIEGFRFPHPQAVWLETLQDRFAGQSTVAAWLSAEARRWPYRDFDGAAKLLLTPGLPTAGPGGAADSGGYSVRTGLAAAVLALNRNPVEARKLLVQIEQAAANAPGTVPAVLWARLAELRLRSGQYEACERALERIPPAQPQYAALEVTAQLYDRWNFGRNRQKAIDRAQAYLAGRPLDPQAWRLLADLQAAAGQWAAAAESLQRTVFLQPEMTADWLRLAEIAQRAGDADLSDRARVQAQRHAAPTAPRWRFGAPSLSLEAMREQIEAIETAPANPDKKAGTDRSPPPAPTFAALRDYEYVLLLDERTDTVAEGGEVEIDHSEWLYLRSRRAAKQHQRMTWPAPAEGLPATVQVRRFRPGSLPMGGAPERELEGVTLSDPATGGLITRLEDLAAGDVLQIRHLTRIPAARVEAAEYAAHFTFGADLPCLQRRFVLVYPALHEALWRRTGAGLDFSSQLDDAYKTTRLTWERAWSPTDPGATAELRLNFQSQTLSALEWLRRRTPSNIALGEDLLAFVDRQRAALRTRPKVSEAVARAMYDFVRTQVQETEPSRPLIQLTVAPTPEVFSRRSGNRWERCRLLASLLRAGGLEAYVYAIRTNSRDMPDPRQQVPVLPEDFNDCVVGWHRPFDSIVWLYPQGDSRLEFGQVPANLGDHPALRLNPRGPVLLERLPHAAPVTLFPGEEAP